MDLSTLPATSYSSDFPQGMNVRGLPPETQDNQKDVPAQMFPCRSITLRSPNSF